MESGVMTALEVYKQNDGSVTTRFYAHLCTLGPLGRVAVALFRAQKRSISAKKYRKRQWTRSAYDVKSWSLEQVCLELKRNPELGFSYGWAQDPNCRFGGEASWVLYVDLPYGIGQVSFHSPTRGEGPAYTGKWDGQHRSAERIIRFCNEVMKCQK